MGHPRSNDPASRGIPQKLATARQRTVHPAIARDMLKLRFEGGSNTMAATGKLSADRHVRIAAIDEAAIRLHIEPLSEGGYVATSRDVPGLVAEGRSITEAVEIAQGLTRKIVESCIEHGDPLPPALAKLRKAPLDLLVPVGVR